MVNQTKQTTTHICKWGSCTAKFDSMMLLWKHVEQHVDNASPRLIHLVNDDDDVPVKAPQNTAITKPFMNSVATSQINHSRNGYPARINTVMNGTSNINNGQNINLMIPLQSMQQTTQSRLQQGSRMLTSQTSPTMIQMFQQQTYLTSSQKQQQQQFIALPGTNYQFQQIGSPFLIGQIQQQPPIIQSAGQTANVIPLGSSPNPITIDDNNTMDVDSPVINVNNHQSLGRSLGTQVQKKGTNSNRNAQSLSQNTKK